MWGPKTFVKRPMGASRKDFSETTKTGFLLGYSDTPKGYKVLSLTLTVLCMSDTGSAARVETSRRSALSEEEEIDNRVSSSSDARGVGIAI